MNEKKEQDETKPGEPEIENRADYSSKDAALWRSLMEASPDFIIIVDGNENIEAINRVAPTMTMEEVLGTSVYNFIPPHYHDLHRQHIRKALDAGESGSFETQGVGPDGKVSAWYRTYIGPVKYDGKIESAILMARDITAQRHLIEQQKQAIEELSNPIIKIWDQVLVLPLIGSLDTRRSQNLTENLLKDIATTQSKIAIMDITGVPAVDSAVANHLLKTISSVKLLGAECVVTGIRPEVAQTIVHLGVDLSEIETLANLAEGLKWAFDKLRINMTLNKED